MIVGEVIRDELYERGWTMDDLEERSQIKKVRIREVCNGSPGMTKVVAIGLSNAFGTSMEFWLNLANQQ